MFFDLEQAIVGWRQQMLAAGIETPEPLEELEAHLCEEIERQTKSGLTEAEAFKAGVQKIGQAHIVQNEFNKVEADHKIKRTIIRATLLIMGWLASFTLLCFGIIGLDFNWNFFSFHPKWDLETIEEVLIILVAEAGIWFLAKASRDRASRVVSLIICVFFVGTGIVNFFHVYDHGIFKVYEIPIWYRGGQTLLLCLPGVFWVWWARPHIVRKRHATRGSQPVRSD